MLKMVKPHMRKNIRSISDVIEKEKEFEKIRKKAKEMDVVESFGVIFPELKNIAKAVRMEKEKLFLRVENSVWRSELNLKQNAIKEKINKHFGDEIIKSIRFI